MAFSCEECIDRLEGPGHYRTCWGSVLKSHGRCEDCGKTRVCIDCRCYKRPGWQPYDRRPLPDKETPNE